MHDAGDTVCHLPVRNFVSISLLWKRRPLNRNLDLRPLLMPATALIKATQNTDQTVPFVDGVHFLVVFSSYY